MSKFKIPSINDIDKDADGIKTSSLFIAHKQQSPQKVSQINSNVTSSTSLSSNSSTTLPSPPKQQTDTIISKTPLMSPRYVSNNLTITQQESINNQPDGANRKTQEGPISMQDETTGKPSSTLKTGFSGKTSSLIVSRRQRGNPILKHVRNVPWEFGDIVPDYQLGQTSCALFLSLRYHALNPTYVHERLKQLGYSYDLRVLLVQVDVKDPHHSLKELAKICLYTDCTMILAWSAEEAGRYLETYKSFENKPPDLIMEKMDTNFSGRVTDMLTVVKKVNKADAVTLVSNFGTLERIIAVEEEELSLCPGFGPQKAKRLHDVFHEPFLKSKKKRLQKTSEQEPSTSSKGASPRKSTKR